MPKKQVSFEEAVLAAVKDSADDQLFHIYFVNETTAKTMTTMTAGKRMEVFTKQNVLDLLETKLDSVTVVPIWLKK